MLGAYAFTDTLAGTLYGAFAGFNVQRGNIVFGGEIAYSPGEINFAGFPTVVNNFLDLKGRIGYAAGSALIYATAGCSSALINGTSQYDMTGINYGFGVDFKVTDSFFVGAEYLIRKTEGTLVPTFPCTFTSEIQSIGLRAGISF